MPNQPQPQLEPALKQAFDHALRFLAADDDSVAPTATAAELRQRLMKPLAASSERASDVITDLIHDTAGGLMRSGGSRFFGWVIGGALPSALAADWLASAWDQNAGVFATSPAASVVEEAAAVWLKQLLGLPAIASTAFVTGCQMAHVVSLLVARHALLAKLNWDVEQQGLSGAPALRVLTSTERHGTLDRAVRMAGIGLANIQLLPADDHGCLDAKALQHALQAQPTRPTIVVLQAGDLNMGAYDNFAELIPIAHEHGAWVHVDGAFGLWAAASPTHRHLMEGCGLADSWATDGHKWLNVPYDSGFAFVADADAHRATFTHKSAYVALNAETRDGIDWQPEWSRRARGFAVYAALRELGSNGVANLVDRNCAQAAALVDGMARMPGVEVLCRAQINQGMVRFLHPRRDEPAAHDAFTADVMAAIVAGGEAYFTGTVWRGMRAMRVSPSNWQTTDADIEQTLHAISTALEATRRNASR